MAAFLEQRFDAHAAAVRRHVDALAAKEYWIGVPRRPGDRRLLRPGRGVPGRRVRGGPLAAGGGHGQAGGAGHPDDAAGPAADRGPHVAAGRPRRLGPGAVRRGSGAARPARHARRPRRQARPGPAAAPSSTTTPWSPAWRRGCWSRPAGCATSGVVDDELPATDPVVAAPRPLTAAELIERGARATSDGAGEGSRADRDAARGAVPGATGPRTPSWRAWRSRWARAHPARAPPGSRDQRRPPEPRQGRQGRQGRQRRQR